MLNLPVKDTDKLRAAAQNDMRVTTIKLPSSMGLAKRADTNTANQAAANAAAVAAAASAGQANNMSAPGGVSPYVNAQMERMRAEAVANAFRPLEPTAQATVGANQLPNMAASPAPVNPNWTSHNWPTPPMQPAAMPNQPVPQMSTGATPTPPRSLNTNGQGNQPYRGDEYPGGLPPGFQFSPSVMRGRNRV